MVPLKAEKPDLTTGDTQVPPPEENGVPTVAPSLQAPRRSISLPTAFILCFIFFLLGSLFRSLLSPTDFVIVENASDPTYLDEHVGWRRLTRLIEFKYLLRDGDLIIGIAHA